MYATVTAKMPGVTMPSRKRHMMSAPSEGAVAAPNVVRATRAADQTMTRFRPSRSATVPIRGAAIATPVVAAVTVRLTATFDAPKTDVSIGSSG
jgi:hypothetical protein